jgi:hypothetical protein
MKKLFFSAVALVAFSSVSMASTFTLTDTQFKDDLKLTEITSTNTNKQEHVVLVSKTCEEAGAKAFIQAVMADVPVDGAYNIALAVYALCENMGSLT